jgi:hypothetical protein
MGVELQLQSRVLIGGFDLSLHERNRHHGNIAIARLEFSGG